MEWRRGPIIGRGSTSTVYLATSLSSTFQFAVKSTNLSSSASLLKEHSLLSTLNSPFFPTSFGFNITTLNSTPTFNLFMEYSPAGTLHDHTLRHGGALPEPAIRSHARRILQGLDYLHALGFAHCDIKSRNILMSQSGLKISDLGSAKPLGKPVGKGWFCGTPVFMAPEVVRGEEQGCASDVWAVGCTVIEMATGKPPWPEIEDLVSAVYRIGFSGESQEIPRWLSEKARDFVGKCLERDWRRRWTARELLQHPFLQDKIVDSPSCVLDYGCWDSLESSETPLILTNRSSCSDSAVERIESLARNSFSCDLDWLDEGWVTVRRWNEEEEGEVIVSLRSDFSDMNIQRLVESAEEDFELETVKFQLSNEYSSLLQIHVLLPAFSFFLLHFFIGIIILPRPTIFFLFIKSIIYFNRID